MVSSRTYQELRNKTVPELFLERVKDASGEVAYRAKKRGIYLERTWLDFYQSVARCASGFARIGLKAGDSLALMGDPSEEYTICELAAQSLGAITYGIHPASSTNDLRFMIEDGKASLFVAGNQEYLDRVLPFAGNIPIVVIDTRGTFGYDHPSLVSYERMAKNGEEELRLTPGAFEEMVRTVKPSDGLFILYTSGTTGRPKGVLISHGKHLAAAYTFVDRYPILLEGTHRAVVYLPLCHGLGKVVALTLPLLAPVIPHYGEDIEDLGQTFFEVAPTVLFTVPNYLKKFASNILVSIENSSPLKKWAYNTALRIGRRRLEGLWQQRKSALSGVAYLLCYYTVFRAILNKIGFDKVKLALSTGAPLPPQLATLWQIYGLNLSEMYSLAETGGGIVSTQGSRFPEPGDVGKPVVCWEVKLSDAGEVMVRGEEMFECYWNNLKLTDEFRDQGGWLRTEDEAEWTSGGGLRILDRVGDSAPTRRSGKTSLVAIENALRAGPYIKEAVVVGHDREYLAALVEIDFEALSDWASRNNISFTGFTSLIENTAAVKHIGQEVEKINQTVEPAQRIKVFRIIPKELSPAEDDGPLTPTRKVRRKVVHRKFKDLIESMYERNETSEKSIEPQNTQNMQKEWP